MPTRDIHLCWNLNSYPRLIYLQVNVANSKLEKKQMSMLKELDKAKKKLNERVFIFARDIERIKLLHKY